MNVYLCTALLIMALSQTVLAAYYDLFKGDDARATKHVAMATLLLALVITGNMT